MRAWRGVGVGLLGFLGLLEVLLGQPIPAGADSLAPADSFVAQLNAARVASGLAPVVGDPRLESLARWRVASLVARGEISHTIPAGTCYVPSDVVPVASDEGEAPPICLAQDSEVFAVLVALDVPFTLAGEVLYGGPDQAEATPLAVTTAFLADDPHRAVLLHPDLTHVGVAIGVAPWLDGPTTQGCLVVEEVAREVP